MMLAVRAAAGVARERKADVVNMFIGDASGNRLGLNVLVLQRHLPLDLP